MAIIFSDYSGICVGSGYFLTDLVVLAHGASQTPRYLPKNSLPARMKISIEKKNILEKKC
jgi:hypothetical protein